MIDKFNEHLQEIAEEYNNKIKYLLIDGSKDDQIKRY